MLIDRVVEALLREGRIAATDSVLVVCGGPLDKRVLARNGFTHVTISNLNDRMGADIAPYQWSRQDAENLTFPDGGFDIVMVHAGLHHCRSPHRALLEMYRVARKMVLVFEARDSAALRLAKTIGLTHDYELEAVSNEGYASGGVANGPIPNFVYRWTEREVLKTVRSFDPAHEPDARFFYGLLLPYQRFDNTSRALLRWALKIVGPVAEAFARLFPKQANEFGFAISKPGRLQPWLARDASGAVSVDRDVVRALGREQTGVQ